MGVREKLVELANDVLRYLPWGEIQKDTAERIVDRMMDHGVTVHKQGKWVKHNFLGHEQWVCSECQTLGSPQWKCCPVCEARMPQPPKGE